MTLEPNGGLDPSWLRELVARALDEDLGVPGHDVTVEATIPAGAEGTAQLVARADGVLAGTVVLPVVLAEVAARFGLPEPEVDLLRADGDTVARGDVVAELRGRIRVLLVAERTALNLICQASGVATHTRAWVRALAGTGAQVLDTRKTVPGLRALQKYAVRCGGGTNKRMGLYDVAMIKDNHKLAAGSITAAYRAVCEMFPQVPIQVEVTTTAEAVEAVRAGARFLLCDNMPVPLLAETVRVCRDLVPSIELEATGGLTLDVAAEYGATGVDYLSVGALTHSSAALDLALDLRSDPALAPGPAAPGG